MADERGLALANILGQMLTKLDDKAVDIDTKTGNTEAADYQLIDRLKLKTFYTSDEADIVDKLAELHTAKRDHVDTEIRINNAVKNLEDAVGTATSGKKQVDVDVVGGTDLLDTEKLYEQIEKVYQILKGGDEHVAFESMLKDAEAIAKERKIKYFGNKVAKKYTQDKDQTAKSLSKIIYKNVDATSDFTTSADSATVEEHKTMGCAGYVVGGVATVAVLSILAAGSIVGYDYVTNGDSPSDPTTNGAKPPEGYQNPKAPETIRSGQGFVPATCINGGRYHDQDACKKDLQRRK